MKKTLKTILGSLLAVGLLSTTAYAYGVYSPFQGGTGTNCIPTLGQILLGTASGTYNCQATSTLGIIAAPGPATPISINGFSSTTFNLLPVTNGALGQTISTGSSTIFFTPALTTGYTIPLTASTTNWNSFYANPSSNITAGTGLSWSGNTLNNASSSPWTLSGSNAYFFGNVGINTNAPVNALSVHGIINNDNTISSTGLITNTGSFALNTGTPANNNIGGNLYFNRSDNYSIIGTSNNFDLHFQTNSGDKMILTAGGRLGLGGGATPTAQLMLTQGGSGPTAGFLITGNSQGATYLGTGFLETLGYNASNNKQMWFGDPDYIGATSSSFVRMTSLNGITSLDSVNGNNTLQEPLQISSPLTVVGNATATSFVDSSITGSTQCISANSSGMFTGTGAPCSNNPTTLKVGNGNLYTSTSTDYILADHFVASSTTSTNTFAGPVTISNTLNNTNAFNLNTGTPANNNIGGNLYLSRSDAYSILGTSNPYDLYFQAADATAMVIKVGGRIGIGTASPSGQLTIASTGNTQNPFSLTDTANSNYSYYFDNGYPAAGVFGIRSTNDSYAHTIFSINTAQNVGIGTTTQATLFTVAGDGYFTGTSTASQFIANLSTATSTFAGFVSIGTTTPKNIFQIAPNTSSNISFGSIATNFGAISFQSPAISTSNYALGGSTNVTDLNVPTGGTMNFLLGNSAKMVMSSTGNFGIGTTTPGSLLTVAGNTSITGNLAVGNYGINATNNSLAVGNTTQGGTITSSGGGSIASGWTDNQGGNPTIIASGQGSFASGFSESISGSQSITSSGYGSFATGFQGNGTNIIASGQGSFVGGYGSTNGDTVSAGNGSFAFGSGVSATGSLSTAFGSGFTNNIANSFMVGYGATPSFTVNGSSVGIGTTTPASPLTLIGNDTTYGTITAARAVTSPTQLILLNGGDANGIYLTAQSPSAAVKGLYINNTVSGGASTSASTINFQIQGSTALSISSTGAVTQASGAPWAGYAMCYATGGTLGHCTTAVGSSGTCTCVAN